MNVNIRIYENTGFNQSNRALNPQVLQNEEFSYVNLGGYWTYQTRNLSTFTIDLPIGNELTGADYCTVDDAYYFIMGYEIITPLLAVLSLTSDDWLTAGGNAGVNVLSGRVVRNNPLDDTMYSNIMDEAFVPSEPLNCVYSKLGGFQDGKSTVLVACNADLSTYNTNDAVTFSDSAGGTVTIPKMPQIASWGTQFGFDFGNATHTTQMPSTIIYKLSDNNSSLFTQLFSLGLEGLLSSTYSVPTSLIGEANIYSEEVDSYTSISNNTNITLVYPVNKGKYNKTKILFCTYFFGFDSSGDWTSLNASEIGTDTQLTLGADLSPQGKPIFQIMHYRNQINIGTQQSTSGAQWTPFPLIFNGNSGNLIQKSNFDFQQSMSQRELNINTPAWLGGKGHGASMLPAMADASANTTKGLLNKAFANDNSNLLERGMTLIQAGGSALNQLAVQSLGVASGMIQGGIELASMSTPTGISTVDKLNNQQWDLQNQLAQFQIGQMYVMPTITQSPTVNLSCYNNNSPTYYQYNLSDNDTQRLDEYFDLFGYACNNAHDDAMWTSGQDAWNLSYTFIQFSGVQLETPNVPYFIRTGIESMLNIGVRLWTHRPGR